MPLVKFIAEVACLVHNAYDRFVLQPIYKSMMGHCGKNVVIRNLKGFPGRAIHRVFLEDNVVLKSFTLISVTGKFVMKERAGASSGLLVITGNHQRKVGSFFVEDAKKHEHDIEKDVIVEEDVWLGANVTLLAGVTVGRGSTVGAGSVCIKSIPPYSVVMGNPAKVVGFSFSPEEILEHEKKLYPEEERLPLDTLEKNYKKHFLDRISEIKSYTKI